MVKNTDTILDTVMILGPKNTKLLTELAGSGKSNADMKKAISRGVEPKVISQYPDFNREVIDTDES